jgi:hypothetical protein
VISWFQFKPLLFQTRLVPLYTQGDFIGAFGLTSADAPKLVAVKTGKRNRYAVYEGSLELKAASEFLDRILGGDMQFKNLPALPDFEPEYLRNQKGGDDDDAGDAVTAADERDVCEGDACEESEE